MASSPELLYLAGLGRSGTTALARLLAAHPEVVMGMERYKYLYPRGAPDLTPEHFTRERFFEFSPDETNLGPADSPRWAKHYADQEAKWDGARYVGDKLTRMVLHQLWRRTPQARFVCIVRPIEDVAASWQRRADDVDDNWPSRHDAIASVELWNAGLRRILKAVRLRPDDIVLLDYERTFGDPSSTSFLAMLDWLGLSETPEVTAALTASHDYYTTTVRDKERRLTAAQSAHISAEADLDLWREVGRHML